jgi:gluconolactonase
LTEVWSAICFRLACIKYSLLLLLPALLANCSDAPDPGAAGNAVREAAPGIVAEGAQWRTLVEGLLYVSGIVGDADGNIYFAESYLNRVYKIDLDQNVTVLDDNSAMTVDVAIGPDGLLYACRNLDAQIIRYGKSGEREVLLQGELTPVPEPNQPGEFCNDLVVGSDGGIWFSDRPNRRVIYLSTDGTSRSVADGFRPNGLTLSADGQMLVVTDSEAPMLHAFKIGANGELAEQAGYFDAVRMPVDYGKKKAVSNKRPGTNSIVVDSEGRFYVATFYGIQVFSPEGRYIGVLDIPGSLLYYNSSLALGASGNPYIYAGGRGGIERAEVLVHAG